MRTGREMLELTEVARVLAESGALRCAVDVGVRETDQGVAVSLSVEVSPEEQDDIVGAARTLELRSALEYLRDLNQLRALAARYGIAAGDLERLLPEV